MLWEYAVDAGSESLRMVKRGSAEILREPCRAALRIGREAPFAWGERALKLSGRAPQGVRVVKPVTGGAVTDGALIGSWARLVISEDEEILKRTNVLVAVSSAMRRDACEELQKRMIDEDISGVGLVKSAFASALGAGENVLGPEAIVLADIGCEKTDLAVISAGRILRGECLLTGSAAVKSRLIECVRSEEGFFLSDESARGILSELNEENPSAVSEKPGFDYRTMLPMRRKISCRYAFDAIEALQNAVSDALIRMIHFLPEELAGDITRRGVLLTGGGARLPGVEGALQKKLNLPVRMAEAPEKCVAKGLIRILNSQKTYRALIEDEMEAVRRP